MHDAGLVNRDDIKGACDLHTCMSRRYSVHRFAVDRSSCLHGFAGYFDCKLYADVHISIHPETFSTGMFSWFPLFIPIRTPM